MKLSSSTFAENFDWQIIFSYIYWANVKINQTAFIGGYFEGITTNHYMNELQAIVNLEKPKISFEHGGIWLGYVYKPKKAEHGGLSMKLGWEKLTCRIQ